MLLIFYIIGIGYERIVLENDAKIVAAAALINILNHKTKRPDHDQVSDRDLNEMSHDSNVQLVLDLMGYTHSAVSWILFTVQRPEIF